MVREATEVLALRCENQEPHPIVPKAPTLWGRSVKTKMGLYRIRNWRKYNAAWVQRGSLKLCVD